MEMSAASESSEAVQKGSPLDGKQADGDESDDDDLIGKDSETCTFFSVKTWLIWCVFHQISLKYRVMTLSQSLSHHVIIPYFALSKPLEIHCHLITWLLTHHITDSSVMWDVSTGPPLPPASTSATGDDAAADDDDADSDVSDDDDEDDVSDGVTRGDSLKYDEVSLWFNAMGATQPSINCVGADLRYVYRMIYDMIV